MHDVSRHLHVAVATRVLVEVDIGLFVNLDIDIARGQLVLARWRRHITRQPDMLRFQSASPTSSFTLLTSISKLAHGTATTTPAAGLLLLVLAVLACA